MAAQRGDVMGEETGSDRSTAAVATQPIVITSRQLELAEAIARDLQRSIGLDEPWTSLNAYLDVASRVDYVRQVESSLGVDLRTCRVLEVGSGMGLFVAVAHRLGIDCVGVEPGANSYAHLRAGIDEILSANELPPGAILQEPGEILPFADGSFDVVVSFQVLEHVADPARCLAEAVRVLRPGGRLFMDMPNHFSWTEGHFGLFWPPLLALSKPLASLYVRLLGRNPGFLKELNLVTPWRVRRWTGGLRARFELHSPGPGPFASPSTLGRDVPRQLPPGLVLPTGQRFGRLGRLVRRKVSSSRGRCLLRPVGMVDHINLVAERTGH
ncbi:MAG: class I SAM-dependent methyltransferase [Isosphaeraceae bacterium]